MYLKKISYFTEINNIDIIFSNFTLFIAANFTDINDSEILKTAKNLINSGLSYICTYGPGCEKANDIFKYANIIWEQEHNTELIVMTNFHNREPIEKALQFFIKNANTRHLNITKHSKIVVCVDNLEWAKICNYLDPQSL